MRRLSGRRRGLAGFFAVLVGLLLVGTVLAAEFEQGEVYRLEAGQVVTDDLYVTASEVYIDGTVQGDLIAAGSYVDVSGTVTGDAMIAAAEINITGTIQDDVRLAAAGIDMAGTIGDDLLMAAGGGESVVSFPVGGRDVDQGIRMAANTQVGGDLVIGAGGADVAGTVAGDLFAGAGELNLAAQVGGDAQLSVDDLEVLAPARVAGTLSYTSDDRATIPEGTAADVEFNQQVREQQVRPNPAIQVLGWLVRTLLILGGFVLLGWLVLRFVPNLVSRPANALADDPVRAGLSGLVIAVLFIFIPLVSALLIFLMFLFWGWFQGIVLFLFLFSILALIWYLSPLVTGLWLGWQVSRALGRELNSLATLTVGMALLVLLGRLPVFGWFIYLLSFIFALGGLFLARKWREPRTMKREA